MKGLAEHAEKWEKLPNETEKMWGLDQKTSQYNPEKNMKLCEETGWERTEISNMMREDWEERKKRRNSFRENPKSEENTDATFTHTQFLAKLSIL